ncbi:MAG: response regulator [Deltaproteobacteria bacterium]|nr:response regulator [Deltaproteobacteria bacterium]
MEKAPTQEALLAEVLSLRARLEALATATQLPAELDTPSRDRLSALSRASFEAIFFSDRGICIDQNETAEAMFGYSLAEALGRPGTDWIHPEDRERVRAQMQRGAESAYEVRALRKDGTVFPCEIQGRMIPYGDRRIRVTALRDISARTVAEEGRRAAEERNEALLAAIPDLIFVLDEDGRYLDFSDSPHAALHAPPEAFLGKTSAEVLSPEIHAMTLATVREVLATGRVGTIRYSLPLGGELHHYEARGAPMGPSQVVFLVRDVTAILREEATRARADRLESTARVASQVAHDFNNLLGPLTGYPELIRDLLPFGHPAQALLDQMEAAATHIADINQQLLTLGRRGHYNQAPVDLNKVVLGILDTRALSRSGLHLRVDLAPDLPKVYGGASQLARVVSNLVANAAEATPTGGEIRIATQVVGSKERPDGPWVRLEVSDTGHGIQPSDLQRIFEPFFSTRSADHRKGSGLGLAVVEGVVHDHGGTVEVSSVLHDGTQVGVLLPVCPPDEDRTPPSLRTGGGERVLVVDDDALQRKVMARLLERAGYVVTTVESGEQALALVATAPPDLAILDMVMPGGMNGAETYRALLQVAPGLRAIIVSGYSDHEAVSGALAAGAAAFVSKPVNFTTLQEAIAAALI